MYRQYKHKLSAFHRSLIKKAGINIMDSKSLLKDKIILAVDDEANATNTIAEVLDMCLVRKANDNDITRPK